MVIDDLYNFDKLVEACGNRYLAVMFISESARKLGQQRKEYRISESKLIQWILTGNCPYTDNQLESMKIKQCDEGVETILCWVSDKEVAKEVKFLYKRSVHNHKLVYSTNTKLGQNRIDRANILLRMIWYSILT